MKFKSIVFIAISALVCSCTKPSNNTTNNTTVLPSTVRAYTVDGVQDVILKEGPTASMPITLTYHDSAQQNVTVSLSGAPSFIFAGVGGFGAIANTGPWSGVPTFTIPLVFYYQGGTPYVKGTHVMTLTCTNATGVIKTLKFNLKLQ